VAAVRQTAGVVDRTPETRYARSGELTIAYQVVGDGPLDLVLIGTGSEVQWCVGARDLLAAQGVNTRVVSMPSWDRFERQPDTYRDDVLPPGVPTLTVEAGISLGWAKYADDSVSIDHYGASAPGDRVMKEFGYTAENVAARARELLALES